MNNNKKIIGIVAIVFIALVGYKFISSSIQENKEKAVLEEKYRLEQLQKSQEILVKQEERQQKQDDIESCIEEARAKRRISTGSNCLNEVGDEALLSCAKKELSEKCGKYKDNIDLSILCLKGQIEFQKNIKEEFEEDEEKCYERHKK